MTSARLPLPCPCAATRACSCVASDDWMSCRSSDSARSGENPQALRGVAAAQNDLALPPKVARGPPGGAFDGSHLLAERLAPGDQFQQLAVQVGQCRA